MQVSGFSRLRPGISGRNCLLPPDTKGDNLAARTARDRQLYCARNNHIVNSRHRHSNLRGRWFKPHWGREGGEEKVRGQGQGRQSSRQHVSRLVCQSNSPLWFRIMIIWVFDTAVSVFVLNYDNLSVWYSCVSICPELWHSECLIQLCQYLFWIMITWVLDTAVSVFVLKYDNPSVL